MTRALTDLGQRAMIIGGVAVIARGVARATRDVDATIAFDGEDDLVARLKDHELVPRIDDAAKFARDRLDVAWAF